MFSVYGVMGEGKKTATKQLADTLSTKWGRAYMETCGYV